MIINDTGYNKDEIEHENLSQDSIEDDPKNSEVLENNLKQILENDIGPNENYDLTQSDGSIENKKKHKSRVPKNYLISNVIGNIENSVVTRR